MTLRNVNYSAPADEAIAVTPSDSVAIVSGWVVYSKDASNDTNATRGLYIGTTGDVSVQMYRTGTAVVFKTVPAGVILPISVIRVNSTGTTASNIVALL